MPATIVDVNAVLLQLGAVQVTGFADGEAMSHDFDGMDFEGSSGSHGEVTVVRKHNNIGTVTFRVMQGSVLNAILKGVHKASLLANGQSFAFTFKDLRGSTSINAAQAIIEKYPKETYGDSANPREWTVKVFNPNTDGGLNVNV
jgi:hypothetical protein